MPVHSDGDPRTGRSQPEPQPEVDADLVEYLVITTAGLSRTATVAGALQDLIDTEQLRILDLVGVQIDQAGGYAAVEPELLSGFADLRPGDEVGGLLSEDDIALACSAMSPGTSALILVVEDGWARRLADAVRRTGGRIAGGERIPRDRIEQSWRGRTRRVREGD
jgi:hypothetical protein